MDREAWLIDLGASFHMTPHRQWFCEYEKFDGGEVFLGDDSMTRIVGRGRVQLLLNDGRIRTHPGVLYILGLTRNLMFVSKMGDARLQMIFEKDTCKMVRGLMVLMRGVHIGTMYKLLGSTTTNECNSSTVCVKDKGTTSPHEETTMLWH